MLNYQRVTSKCVLMILQDSDDHGWLKKNTEPLKEPFEYWIYDYPKKIPLMKIQKGTNLLLDMNIHWIWLGFLRSSELWIPMDTRSNTGCSPSKKPRPNWIKCHLHLADVKVAKACASSDEPLLTKTAKIMGNPRGKLRFEGENHRTKWMFQQGHVITFDS
jgi:hypothetical protein